MDIYMYKVLKRFVVIILIQFLVVSISSAKAEEVKDCFEKINRATFAFNMALDKILFKPISKGYRYLPSPIRHGTSNALNNLSNLVTVPNNLIQGDFKAAANNSARFIINSTIGILGLFDPAENLGLSRLEKEDYGQSFGKMGIGEGCYLVLPVLGPSTARDAIGHLSMSERCLV